MKNEPSIDVITVLAMAGQLTMDLQRVIDFHNEQLRILKDRLKHIPRLTNNQRARLAAQFNAIEKSLRESQETVVTPRTLMNWYRRLIKEKWTYAQKQKAGRPGTERDKVQMVLRMAEENPQLGYRDIANRMENVGWKISYQTVRNILLGHGVEPSKQRMARLNWDQFNKANWNGLYALDFTTVEVMSDKLETHYVLFVMKLSTRKVHFAGRTRNPNTAWVQQTPREISNPIDGFLRGCTHMIMDNDGSLGVKAVKPLIDAGIKVQRTPVRAPNCNAYIERFNATFKSGALSHVIPRSGAQLDAVTKEFVTFYNHERNHQGIEGKIIEPKEGIGSTEGCVKIRSRNHGSLNYYYRYAA